MSKQTSKATLEAMHDNDSKHAGDLTSGAKEMHAKIGGKEHTRPQGDLRDVADKADSNSAYRGEINRGH